MDHVDNTRQAEQLSDALGAINRTRPKYDLNITMEHLEILLKIGAKPGQQSNAYAELMQVPGPVVDGHLKRMAGFKQSCTVLQPTVEFRAVWSKTPGTSGGWYLSEYGQALVSAFLSPLNS